MRNLTSDALQGGFWIFAIGGSLLPSAMIATIICVNNFSMGGWRLWFAGIATLLSGALVAALLFDWHPNFPSSLATQLACVSALMVYMSIFSATMRRLARQLAASREVQRRLIRYDTLSDVYNRRYFEERLAEAFRQLHRYNDESAALLMCDVDHFKQINDTRGHLTGDMVIRHVGMVLRSHVRSGDIAARYGGDEFVILLRKADAAASLAFVERIRTALSHPDNGGDAIPAFTLSIGIALYDGRLEKTDNWMALADKALYCVKERQRGGVEVITLPAHVENAQGSQ